MNYIPKQIRTFIQENLLLDESEKELGEGDSLLDMGLIDSQGFMELVSWLEYTYDITIDYDEMIPENLDSINHIVDFIKQKKS